LNRISRLRQYLQSEKLGAFLVLTKINRQYISGFTGSAGAVLVSKKRAELFVDDRYLIRARRESSLPVKNLKSLGSALKQSGKIGIEDRISLRELKWLKKFGGRHQVTRDVVENMRAVKTAQELAAISQGQLVVDKIFQHIKKFVKLGMTEAAVSLEMTQIAKKLGADGMAFDSIVAFGANAAAPHHLSGSTKIGKNNFLLLDFGVLVDGYHSDFTRTLFLGKPNKKQERVYQIVQEAQQFAISKVRPGAKASGVDAVARDYIASQGFGQYFTHNSGHGVGLEIHELPNFSTESEDVLQANMVVTVEPGIYIEKWGGVRIEDMVIVDNRSGKVPSKIPRDLKTMIIN
jgi:Xaa-Pro aminopeptidase